MDELGVLLAFVSGLLAGMSFRELGEYIDLLRAAAASIGLFGLIAPAMGIVNYTVQVMQADPASGVVSVAYALAYYLLYYVVWLLSAVAGSMIEKAARNMGYMAGRAVAWP